MVFLPLYHLAFCSKRAAVAALIYVVPVVLEAHRGIISRPQDIYFSPAAVPDQTTPIALPESAEEPHRLPGHVSRSCAGANFSIASLQTSL